MGDTLDKNFDNLFTEANAGTDVIVQRDSAIDSDFDAERGVIDASIADDIASVDGVAAALPYVEGYGQILGKDGDALGGNGPPQLAGSWTDDADLNSVPHRGRARARERERGRDQPGRGEGRRPADRRHDDGVDARTARGRRSSASPRSATRTASAAVTMAFFTLDAAQQYIAHDASQVTSILVRADDGVSQEELATRVAAVLPDGVEAITGRANTAQDIEDLNAQFLSAFKTFLVIFAGIALLVAAFSIHNTFSILVAQRTRESALLRTIGASRRQILTWVTLEALVLGVWASVAGLFGGIALAQLLKLMFDAFGFALPAGGIAVDTSTVVISLIVGVLVTMVAGAGPAWKATRIAPLAVLRETSVDRTERVGDAHHRRRRAAGGRHRRSCSRPCSPTRPSGWARSARWRRSSASPCSVRSWRGRRAG